MLILESIVKPLALLFYTLLLTVIGVVLEVLDVETD